MQRALDFLKNHVEIAFATSEGNRPHIRIFQIMKMEDSTLFFATSPEKEVYRQLLENPFVEIMANEGKEFVKVNGKADFGVEEETQKWIYEHNPVLPRLYTSFDKLAYFKVEIAEMDHYDLTSTPPMFKHYNMKDHTVSDSKHRMQNLDKMCCMLMKDIGESYAIPADLKGKQQMLRGLMNLRYPIAMNADFLTLQDKELQMQRKEKGEVSVGDISKDGAPLILWQGDITRLRVDAIVNAANSQMLGCFQPLHSCIDNAIHSAAGIQLRDICNRMMMKQGHPETTGKAKITPGFNLPARYVIHTVGPIIPDGEPTREQCTQLASCYHECLQLAERNGLESIAFCCISTGVFRFPNQLAAEIAVREVKSFMNQAKYIRHVIFNVFKDQDRDIYYRLLQADC